MKKIPTIYKRDPDANLRYVKAERHPDCGWVFDGEGEPTYKWDGTAALIKSDGAGFTIWRRREIKEGTEAPAGWVPASVPDVPDPITGKRVGWVQCGRDNPADRWHWEAFDRSSMSAVLAVGTYELVGPKINRNPHGLDGHQLIPHGGIVGDVPTDFEELGAWLHRVADKPELLEDEDGAPYPPGFEGIVWHHPDGRMAKIKSRDFPAQIEDE